MAVVYVNNKAVDIGNEKLNLIQAAMKAGVFIPHYCWHPALTVVASCRMCLVEVGERKPDGTIAMQPKVVPGLPDARQGRHRHRHQQSARRVHAQQQTLESLLINHPLDCPVCDKAGECLLQDYSYNYGQAQSRMIDDKNQPPNKPHIGEQITLFADRCIMCSRCVRFTREISGTAELQVINRGDHSEIDIFPGEPCNNKLAGNVVDLCPVGRPVQQGLSLQAARLVPEDRAERLPRLQHRLQHLRRPEQGHRLSAPTPGESAGAGPLHVRRGPLRLSLRERPGAHSAGTRAARWRLPACGLAGCAPVHAPGTVSSGGSG